MKKLSFLLLFILVIGGSFLAIYSDESNTKFVHTRSAALFVKKALELSENDRRDLLKIHSEEVLKVSEYTFTEKHIESEVINYFINKGWTREAVLDSIGWSLAKAYYLVASEKKVSNGEIFGLIKQEKPAWTDQFSQVLIEEASLDLK